LHGFDHAPSELAGPIRTGRGNKLYRQLCVSLDRAGFLVLQRNRFPLNRDRSEETWTDRIKTASDAGGAIAAQDDSDAPVPVHVGRSSATDAFILGVVFNLIDPRVLTTTDERKECFT
jgi:hypothetical protein